MKNIKFLQESFETKERFQQGINFKYSYNRDTVESVNFRINQRNIKYFYEAMQNFENSLVNEFKEKKNNFCDAKQFLESINDFDKIIFVIITRSIQINNSNITKLRVRENTHQHILVPITIFEVKHCIRLPVIRRIRRNI